MWVNINIKCEEMSKIMPSNVVFLEGKDKLKVYRKQFRLTQGDLENEAYSRGYFGLMENGKRNISYKVSSYLSAFFMEKAKEKGINLSLEDDYFSRPIEVDAGKYCEKKLKESLSIEELNEIMEICEKYNHTELLALALRKKGDIYFNEANYIKAYKKYLDAFDLIKPSPNNTEHNYILYRLGLCNFHLASYSEALVFFEKILSFEEIKQNKTIYLRTIYNSALCYKKLKNIPKALDLVDLFIYLCDVEKDPLSYIDILTIKANCFEQIQDFKAAIDINNYLINFIEDHENEETTKKLGMVYNNLGSLEIKNHDPSKALGYFNKSLAIRNTLDLKFVSHTLIDKADVYITKGLYDEAIMILSLGMEKAKDFDDGEYLLSAYEKLEKIYSALGLKSELKEVLLNALSLVKKNKDPNLLTKYYLKLQGVYFEEAAYEKAFDCYINLKELLKF